MVKPARITTADRGYGARWQSARLTYLQAHPFCELCRQAGRGLVPATVVDHIKPHRMGEAIASGSADQIRSAQALFWDRGNWQPLCKPCHDGAKQSFERTGRMRGCNADGTPIDPGHHWRQSTD